MLANSPQESNLALVSWLALLPVPTSTFKIRVEMVHSFAKKRLKAKRVNQRANQHGPVAKFISHTWGIEPCTPASKMKGKWMTSDQNQLHQELRRLRDGDGQRPTAVSAQVAVLGFPNLLDPNSIVCETQVLGCVSIWRQKPFSWSHAQFTLQAAALVGVAQSWASCLLWPRYSCRFVNISQNNTPV